MTDHANELRRHARKLGSPAGDTPSVMAAAAAHIDAQAAEIERLQEALRTVERWANHHARKPATTAAEALGVIQHHPVIRAITAGYADGVIPSTPDPYAEIERLKEALHALTYGDNGKPEFDEARTLLVGWWSEQ